MTPTSPAATDPRTGGFSLVELLIALFILTLTIHALGLSILTILRVERDALNDFRKYGIFLSCAASHWSGERSLDALEFPDPGLARKEVILEEDPDRTWIEFRLEKSSRQTADSLFFFLPPNPAKAQDTDEETL